MSRSTPTVSPSRTSICIGDMKHCVCLIALAVACLVHGACKGKKPIAGLDKGEGTVERQAGGATAWAGAPIGAKFFLGDAARTGPGGAQLTLGGAAQIAMQPH